MALATRCPNCNALFRVAAEQLRSRGGMVRCGSCRRVFNAIAGLDYLDAERLAADDAPTRPPVAPPPPAVAARQAMPPPFVQAQTPAATLPTPASAARSATLPSIRAAASPARLPQSAVPVAGTPPATDAAPDAPAPQKTSVTATVTKAPPPAPVAPAPVAPAPVAPAPGERRRNPRAAGGRGAPPPTLSESDGVQPLRFAPAEASGDAAPEGQGVSFDTLFIVPRDEADGGEDRGTDAPPADADADAPPEPRFLQDTPPSPLVRGALVTGCALLLPLLLAQLALIFRAPLVVAWPALQPALQALCTPLACSASWPMRPDLLAVVSSELQSVPGTDALELDAVLRSRAAYPLALPAIELTISDNSGHAVARKVFVPAEYLGSGADTGADPAGGNIAAGADLTVRVFFALPGISAVNFEAYPFYP